MNYYELKNSIFLEIDKYRKEIFELGCDLADEPELSSQEFESSRKIVELLKKHGYQVEYPFAGFNTAFKGVYGNNKHKYKVAILAEYDALPEIGHACGHCLSGAISVLAALATRQLQDLLDVDIHIIGTPDEEVIGTKALMVNDCVFDNYDMTMMVHLYNSNLLAPKMQSCTGVIYEFRSVADENTEYWGVSNPLDAVRYLYHAIDMMRQHNRLDAQIHGIVQDGGKKAGEIPETITTELIVRALDRDYLNELITKVKACVSGAAIATRTTVSETPDPCISENLNVNNFGTNILSDVYNELGLEINGDPEKIFGTSDIGNVSYICPSFHPCLQVVDEEITIHSRGFADAMKTQRACDTMVIGAKIIGLQIAKIFMDENNILAMKEEFIESIR